MEDVRRMGKLSIKERIMYRFVCSENTVYKHWYSRFLFFGVDLDRIRRVVQRIDNFYEWCDEWSKEGAKAEALAEGALSRGDTFSARRFFHEAAGCYHISQHVYFCDAKRKNEAQEKIRENYRKAIDLYDEEQRPIRVEIPFRGTVIPGYLRLGRELERPLVLWIDGGDNLKEVENHYAGNLLLDASLNCFAFGGPGQGEMWKSMKLIPDYEKVVSAIIDWFEKNNDYKIDLSRIGTCGMSLGGYLSPRSAAFDKRISCAVGNGGFGYLNLKTKPRGINPMIVREFLYMTGFESVEEAGASWGEIDIKEAPRLDRPLLFIQGGKELKYYPDGEHCCGNYMDEVIPLIIDWLQKHLNKNPKRIRPSI